MPRFKSGHGCPGAALAPAAFFTPNSRAQRMDERHNSIETRRGLTGGRIQPSFADRIKDVVRAFTPREMLEEDPEDSSQLTTNIVPGRYNRKFVITHDLTGQHVKLPAHLVQLVEKIELPTDRLLALIRTREVPIDVLLVLYRPLVGMLNGECTLEFAKELYKCGKYEPCLEVITENLGLSDTLSTVETLIQQLSKEGVDSKDFLICEIVRGFIKRGQKNTATQLLSDEGTAVMEECELQHYLLNANDIPSMVYTLQASDLPRNPTLAAYFPHLSPATQVAILKALIQRHKLDAFSELCTPTFLRQPGVLRSMIRSFVNSSSPDMTFDAPAFQMFLRSVCDSLRMPDSVTSEPNSLINSSASDLKSLQPDSSISTHLVKKFSKHDLISIPQLGHNKYAFESLWKAFLKYTKMQKGILVQSKSKHFGNSDMPNINFPETGPNNTENSSNESEKLLQPNPVKSPVRHRTKALKSFLQQSISLHLSYASVDILEESNRTIIDIPLLCAVINQIAWAQRCPTDSDESVYWDTNSTNTDLLRRVRNGMGKKHFLEASILCFKKINSQLGLTDTRILIKEGEKKLKDIPAKVFPGRPLWKLVNELQYVEWTDKLELQVATSMASRPLVEQLKYYTLPRVTSIGIEQALCAHIDAMQHRSASLNIAKFDDNVNEKLIICGLVLAEQKSRDYKSVNKILSQSSIPARTLDVSMVELFSRLSTAERPVCVDRALTERLFKYMIKRKQFAAMLRLGDLITSQRLCNFTPDELLPSYDVPLKIYYWLLIDSSEHEPAVCTRLFRFLKAQGRPIPSWAVREISQGFAKSRFLTSGQSTRRVVWMFRVLRSRGEPLGRETITTYVESLLRRSREDRFLNPDAHMGTGGRQRLKWAISLAKQEQVSELVMQKWLMELGEMKHTGKGYWHHIR